MEDYKEIDLYQFGLTIRKNWRIISVFFLIFILGSLFYVKYSSADYTISSSLEIGSIEDILIESPAQLSAKINKGVYGNYPNLKSVTVDNANIVDVTISTDGNPEKSREFMDSLNAKIIQSHQAIIDAKKQKLEKMKKTLEDEIVYLISKNQQIATVRLRLISLQAKLEEDDVVATKIISEAEAQEKKPNLSLILSAAGVLGLFFGVLFVFSKE